ncbi:hypothetical protein ACJIZ3_007566 [Penstemon smallii]|uniref:Dof zinc finger protein n=1 Tax=Penstemon smallii TaxID=265156 RepID=A0ABD3T7Z5_9LAMI
MDSAQWMQEIGVAKSMDSSIGDPRQVMEKKVCVRAQKEEQAINCPRCNSTNTKFCYYNNYSLTQPRYFCKTCRRYWTEGGTLRNVPVGGGSRKNKKSTSSSSSQSIIQSHNNNNNSISSHDHHPNPKIHINEYHDQRQAPLQDLNLGFQAPQDHYNHSRGLVPQFLEFPKVFEGRDLINTSSSSTSSSSAPISALNLLRNEIAVKGFNNPFIAMAPAGGNLETNAYFPSNNFQFNQECKPPPSLANFSFDGINNNNNNNSTMINGSINVFPFGGVMKRHSSTSEGDDDQGKRLHENNSNGFWNGMLGGGSW